MNTPSIKDGNRRPDAPAAPAIHLCPKCGTSMRQYRRSNGQRMLQCLDRKGCNLRMPVADAPPDHGLTDLKPAPVATRDGLSGLSGLRAV
jgi:ssDNA-binding Zn-finger/Zn-ribbon topoisomerase 1